jgi:phage recombination protein Bet
VNAIVKAAAKGASAALDFLPHQLALIQKTIARDCNDAEFDLFMETSRMRGLNPLANQVSVVVFNKDDDNKRNMVMFTRIDGLRALAERHSDYRPMEEPGSFETDEQARDPLCNPLGLISCTVKLWKFREGGWHPVIGRAFWEEYAPVIEEPEGGWEWEETGEVWKDSGKPKKKKVARGAIVRKLDTRGNWGRMGRHMLEKCAEAIALRRGWPETFSGLYGEEELDRARIIDVASEAVADYHEQERMKKIGAGGHTLIFVFDPAKPLESIERGKVADRIFAFLREAQTPQAIDDFLIRNKISLQTFWAWEKAEALEIKKFAEQRKAVLGEHGSAAPPAAEDGASDPDGTLSGGSGAPSKGVGP